ncbi:MAG TPA: BTAD domain-containing putative transcriptional regulator [Nocardioidaceae bacterium]|nr:BTAD domain-containing putative transcriptional regulator [Nocardioidaceae bacterium]
MTTEEASDALFFRMLGPLVVEHQGVPVKIGTRRQRALLTLLLLQVGKAVSAERLIDQLWQGGPPPQAAVTLRSYISYLRVALKVDGSKPVLLTRGQGYAIEVDPTAVDAVRLERLVEDGRDLTRRGAASEALDSFTSALQLWRGDPLAEVADLEAAQSTITRLRELRLAADEGRFEALLALGRHLDALPSLEAFVSDNPLRENPRGQLMLALYRAGRAPDALNVHRQFRALLADELGLDPSPSLDALMQQILEQSPQLDAPAASIPAERSAAAQRAPTDTAALRPKVVGRRSEMAALVTSVDRLVDGGAGALLLVAGEAGIGKSTMLLQLRELADRRGVRMHRGRSPAATGAPAFWPWTQAITALADTMDDETLTRVARGAALPVTQVAEEVARRLARRHEVTAADPHAARFLLYEALTTFLVQASQEQPLVLALDDLHWADVPSLELLAHLAPRLSTSPILLAAAYRDVPSERSEDLDAALASVSREDSVEEIVLRGLSHHDVAGVAEAVSGVSVSDDVVTLLHERTAGNPFFVRQMAQLLAESNLAAADYSIAATLPPGIRHVLNSRTRNLPRATKELLDVASVLGRDFEPAVVARAADVDVGTALDALDVAARHGLIEVRAAPFTGYRFIHGLVQEAVYESLAPGRALKLHARAADALEAVDAPISEVAEHMWRAAELVADGRPLRYTLAAADHAATLLAYEQAELYLHRALRLIQNAPYDPQTELGVVLNLFRFMATNRGWGNADAREVVQRARRLMGDAGGLHGDLAHLWFSLWMSLNSRNELETADQVALTLMPHAETATDPAARVAGHLMLAFRKFRQLEHWREGVRELELAQQLARTAPSESLAAYPEHLGALVLLSQAETIAFLGDPRAVDLDDEAIELAEQSGRPGPRAFAYTIAALNSALLGDAELTQRLARVGREISKQYGLTFLERVADYADAWAAAKLGADPAEPVARIEAAIQAFRSAGDAPSEAHALLLLADVFALAGDADRARQCLVRVRRAPGPFAYVIVHYVDQKMAAMSADGS